MNNSLKIILFIHIFIFFSDANEELDLSKKMDNIESSLSCKNSKGDFEKFSKCIDKRIEIKIDESYQNGVQIGVYRDKYLAEKKVLDSYTLKKDKLLKDAEIKSILVNNENIKGYEHLEKGKNFYFVVVYEKNMDLKVLEKRVKRYEANATIFYKPRIVLSSNRVKKNNEHENETIEILKIKLGCVETYNITDGKELQNFMDCLKRATEQENIEGVQMFLFVEKNQAENETKKYNEWEKKKGKKSEASWGEKKYKGKWCYSVVIKSSLSSKILKRRIRQYLCEEHPNLCNKKNYNPFYIKKPKVNIQYRYNPKQKDKK